MTVLAEASIDRGTGRDPFGVSCAIARSRSRRS
jgi:hypothetical protein